MDISITLANRELKPAVLNFFQFENQAVTLNFTLSSYMYEEVNLRNYKAYAVTSQNGMVDMTELEQIYDAETDKLKLKWVVQEYSLRQVGPILYQIVFKENADDGENTAVFYTYKGIMINRGSVNGDDHITANYPTLLKQWLDKISELAGSFDSAIFYMPYGQATPIAERLAGRLYYQFLDAENKTGRFEDHTGKILMDSSSVYVSNANLNTLLENKTYICAGTMTNTPVATTYCVVNVYDSNSTNRIIQEVSIPQADNTVRVFVRAITGTSTFGAWRELSNTAYVDDKHEVSLMLINEKDFEISAIGQMISLSLSKMFIQCFEETETIDSTKGDGAYCIENYYNADKHIFIKNDDTTKTIYSVMKVVSSGNNKAWATADWTNVENGSITLEITRDGGTTWTTLPENILTTISSQPTGVKMILRITATGKVTLKNVAWGMKS